MKCYIIRPGGGKRVDVVPGIEDHQVHIKAQGCEGPESGHYRRTYGYIRDKGSVHHIQMYPTAAVIFYITDTFFKITEIRSKNGRCENGILHIIIVTNPEDTVNREKAL
jgi:hypothetical protein